MAPTAADALQKAAERARRRVDLEIALERTRRALGYDILPEQFPWVEVLSMPYTWG